LSKIVSNERHKLVANYCNGIAIAAVGVGGLTQAATMVQSLNVSPWTTIFIVICLVLSYALHSLGKAALSELEE
jgi:hypothetical protein